MSRGTCFSRLALGVLAAAAVGGSAHAGLLPNSVTVFDEAGNYRWQYAIVLPTDNRLQSGNYFTIYDFAGLIEGTVVAPNADWEVGVQNVGPTQGRLLPSDDPNIPNLTFKYTGATVDGQVGLGNFMATSMFDERKTADFTSDTLNLATNEADDSITTTVSPTGEVIVDPPGVPEPATLLLAGLGLPLLGLARLRKKKVAA